MLIILNRISGYQIPTWISPLAILVVTSILIPNTSFLGHLCGCATGYLCMFLAVSPVHILVIIRLTTKQGVWATFAFLLLPNEYCVGLKGNSTCWADYHITSRWIKKRTVAMVFSLQVLLPHPVSLRILSGSAGWEAVADKGSGLDSCFCDGIFATLALEASQYSVQRLGYMRRTKTNALPKKGVSCVYLRLPLYYTLLMILRERPLQHGSRRLLENHPDMGSAIAALSRPEAA